MVPEDGWPRAHGPGVSLEPPPPQLNAKALVGSLARLHLPMRIPAEKSAKNILSNSRPPLSPEKSAAKFAPHPIVPEEATRPSAHGPTGVSNARRRAGTDPPPAEEPEPVML